MTEVDKILDNIESEINRIIELDNRYGIMFLAGSREANDIASFIKGDSGNLVSILISKSMDKKEVARLIMSAANFIEVNQLNKELDY